MAIRLTDERWAHITEEHTELAGYRLEVLEALAAPERVVSGGAGDGFVITAFLTRREAALERRKQLWP